MNSKRAYARSAHARGKRYFVYSQWGKGCCSFSFSCLPAIMTKIVLNVCYHFALEILIRGQIPLFFMVCVTIFAFLYCNMLIFLK